VRERETGREERSAANSGSAPSLPYPRSDAAFAGGAAPAGTDKAECRTFRSDRRRTASASVKVCVGALRRAHPALTERAGVGSIPANPDA
jgi:hypothetical protein